MYHMNQSIYKVIVEGPVSHLAVLANDEEIAKKRISDMGFTVLYCETVATMVFLTEYAEISKD